MAFEEMWAEGLGSNACLSMEDLRDINIKISSFQLQEKI